MLRTVYKSLLRDVKEPLQTERHKQLTRRDSCHVPSLICNKALKKKFFFGQFRIFVRSAVRTIKKLSLSDVERLLQNDEEPLQTVIEGRWERFVTNRFLSAIINRY
jgi:hypothetical protein